MVSTICALTPDKNEVYQYNGSGTSWTRIGGAANKLFGGAAGLVATRPPNGDLFQYQAKPDKWERIGGPGASFVLSDTVFGLSPDKKAVYRHGGDSSWDRVGGPADRLYGCGYSTGDGVFATNPTNGDLFRYFYPNMWKRIGGPYSSLAITGEMVYGLSPDKRAVYELNVNNDTSWTRIGGPGWTRIGGPGSKLYACGFRVLLATDPTDGSLFRYLDTPDEWERIGGPGAQFAVTYAKIIDGAVYGLTLEKNAVYRYNGSGTSWTRVGGPAHSIVAFENEKVGYTWIR